MKKIFSLFLVISITGLFGCGKKKDSLKYVKERFDIDEKLKEDAINTTISTYYAWYENGSNYRKCDRITTKYDSYNRKKDELHEIFNRDKSNDWCGYNREVLEYNDENGTISCYNCYYAISKSVWVPSGKTITYCDEFGKTLSQKYYICSDYDSKNREGMFVLYTVTEYEYDERENLITEKCNHYHGLSDVFFVEKTEYKYNDNNQLVESELLDRHTYTYTVTQDESGKITQRKENEADFKRRKKIEYNYEDNLLANKIEYYFNEKNYDSYSRNLYTYAYDENGNITKEIESIDYSGYTISEFVESHIKEYTYEDNMTIIYEYHNNLLGNNNSEWLFCGKEEIVTEYVID